MPERRHQGPAVAGMLLGIAMVAAAVVLITRTSRPAPTAVGRVPAAVAPAPKLRSAAAAPPTTAPTPAGSPPGTVVLPSLGVTATVQPVGVDPTGSLGVPPDPQVVGWWSGSARPGAAGGRVVLDGHVDTRAAGAGALFDLQQLLPGQPVDVGTPDGTVAYQVVARAVYAKGALPPSLWDSASPSLVIITCGGPFDAATGHYLQNVVVYASPSPAVSG